MNAPGVGDAGTGGRNCRAVCPNCGRGFNCDGGEACWCLKVERDFDYAAMILRTGETGCVCPVCLTGRSDLAEVETEAPAAVSHAAPRRRGGRRRNRS